MFYNVHYDYRRSEIHLWESVQKTKRHLKLRWVPYVWVKVLQTKDSENEEIASIYGDIVEKKTFRSWPDYRDFNKQTKWFENKVKPEIQFLTDRYYDIADDKLEVPVLDICYLDIEVHREHPGFPKPEVAEDPISLISYFSSYHNHYISFGLKPYNKDYKEDLYVVAKDERDLILKFLRYFNVNAPDVITGWNVLGFDLPYIINRIKNIFPNTDTYKLLSPIKEISIWESTTRTNIDIPGISILDYMDLYKTYSPRKPESYGLKYVANLELGKTKYDYSATAVNLKELYHKDWQEYVNYNKRDIKLVKQLEDKLGYISLIQSLSLLTKCPMKFYHTQTALSEGAILTYLRRKNKCAPKLLGGHKDYFEAALVKESRKGKFNWIVDTDIASSYPTAIITLNMSNETYLGRILNLSEEDIVGHIRNKTFPDTIKFKNVNGEIMEKSGKTLNAMLEQGKFSIAPNGVVFKNDRKGTISEIQREYFSLRKTVKKKMLKAMAKQDTKNALKFKNLQTSLKLILNSMYGGFSVPYSRYFNLDIAEAITSCGRHSFKSGEKFINEILNSPNKELEAILKSLK